MPKQKQSTLIEHTIRRKNGSLIPIEDEEYHFLPLSDAKNAPHIAEVKNRAHVARFLSIPTFREYDPEHVDEPVKPPLLPERQPAEDMSMRELRQYAKDLGINDKSKEDIHQFLVRFGGDAVGYLSKRNALRSWLEQLHTIVENDQGMPSEGGGIDDDYSDLPEEELVLTGEDLAPPTEGDQPVAR